MSNNPQSIRILAGASLLAMEAAFAAPQAAAQPATTLFGGGGTMAAKAYRDIFNCYSASSYGIYGNSSGNPAGASYPAGLNAKCTTDEAKDVAFAYAPVGTAAGISAFITGNPTYFGIPASNNPVAYLNSSATVGASAAPYPQVNFVGTDSYLTSAQLQEADTVDGGAAVFVLPVLATPITLPVGQVNDVSLSLKTVCDIFSGQTKVPGNPAALQQIFVQTNGEGSSAIFGSWLEQNCSGNGAQGKAYQFTAANGFGTLDPNWLAALVGSLGTVSTVTGSAGMANAVASASYSIGYVSPDYDYPIVATSKAYSATVNGESTAVAKVTTHIDAITLPTGYTNNIGQTLNLASTAQALSTTGYPIVGFLFLDTYGCYSATYDSGEIGDNAKGNLLKNFFTALYTPGPFATEATAILNAAGFAAPPAALVSLYKGNGGPISSTGINGTECPAGRT